MILFVRAIGLLSALFLSFISSGMETAIYRVSRVRMRILAEQGSYRARLVLRILDNIDAMVTTILIDNNIAAYAATYFVTMQMAAWRAPHAELVTTALVTPVFFVFTESLPKQLAFSKANTWALELCRAFRAFQWIFAPAVWLLNKASALLRRLLRVQGDVALAASQRDILLEHFSAGVAEEVLTEDQSRMAKHVMEMEGISSADVMIPLGQLVLLPADAPRKRATREMSRRHAKLALLTDAQNRPNGTVATLNALVMTAGGPDDQVGRVAEKLDYVRDDVSVSEVLKLFRRRHTRLALVASRGRVAGLITSMALLDRIAGLSR